MASISILMGIYNCKNKSFLEKSINSILAQTYTDWELIICDDGSTDDTFEFVKELEKKDSRIKVIGYHENH